MCLTRVTRENFTGFPREIHMLLLVGLSSIIPFILRGRFVVAEPIFNIIGPCVIVYSIRKLAHIAHSYGWNCVTNLKELKCSAPLTYRSSAKYV